MLWLDDFNEHQSDISDLNRFTNLLVGFRDRQVKVINLYGSFFSILLTSDYLKDGRLLYGVGHGLEYGESRAVYPIGGGVPTNKYYYRDIHKRVNYSKMSRYLSDNGYFDMPVDKAAEKYYVEICGCSVCREIIKNDIRNFQLFENTEFYNINYKSGRTQRRTYANQTTKQICVTHYLRNKMMEFNLVEHKDIQSIINTLQESFDELTLIDGNIEVDYLSNWITAISKFKSEISRD